MITRTLVGFCVLNLLAANGAPAEPRRKISLNADWSFRLEADRGDADAVTPAAWRAVDLPHTWNTADSRDEKEPYHRGVGVYRKSLFVSPSLAGKTLYLYFEGANQVADVSVNGAHAGRHVGGYTAFALDVGELVRFGEQNEIEVRVDNRHDEDVPPLNADFTFYGGIYRDVWLLALDDVHFAMDRYAATELEIRTVSVSRPRAIVEIDAGIANRSGEHRRVRVETSIEDADGTVIARRSIETGLDGQGVTSRDLARFEIEEPSLWSPESPYLYRVVCTIRDGARMLDRVQYPLGLRRVELDAEEGLRLNGKPYRLFGTNRHQDHARMGNALPDAIHRSDLRKIKENGLNFLRLAHYPQDPAVLDAADELGLLVWEEIPIVNLIGLSGEFRENSTRMLREMIRQHRHHPSVIFWGYMNEVTLRDPEPMPAHYHDRVIELARHLDAVAHEEDPSRPTVMAVSRGELDDDVPLHTVPDALGLNLYFGWYYGELGSLGAFLDAYHRKHPDLPLIISEYGAGSDERVHAPEPEPFDFSTEYQQRFHEAAFRQILERPWLVGSAVWAQFDFGSNHRQDTKFGINQKGLWYYDRRPKDVAWFYKAQLSDEPVLHIAVRDWLHRAGSRPGDAVMPVRVYSNAATVELSVNGESLGSRPVRNATAVWDVSFAPGENRLSARSAASEDDVTVHYEDRTSFFREDATVDAPAIDAPAADAPAVGAPVVEAPAVEAPAVDAPAVDALLVNAGAGEQFVARDGRIWEADREYRPGSWGHVGGEAERSHHRIYGTQAEPLYQTRRRGPHAWRFDVPDGRYRLELHFAPLADRPGRTADFALALNGRPVDVEVPPPFTRRDVEMTAVATGGEGLELRFPDDSREPFVNGILLQRLPEAPGNGSDSPATAANRR